MRSRAAVRFVVFAIVPLLACERGGAPASVHAAAPTSPVEGVWRITEVSVVGDSARTTDPPSLYIFAGSHYAIMHATGTRTPFAAVAPDDAEKIAAYDSFIANAGTYELAGTTLTVRPIIAKHPNFMGGGFDTYELRLAGDTLWLTSRSANIRFRLGGDVVGTIGTPSETRLKLVRVE